MPRKHKGIRAQNRIIIGENMSRLKAAGRRIGAKWYQARQLDPWDALVAMRRNRAWIEEKMKKGCEIVDIGIDPTRSFRSPFYKMEREILIQQGYPITPYDRISKK